MNKKNKGIILYIFLISLVVRIVFLIFYPPVSGNILTPLNDSTDYHHLAKCIRSFSFNSPSGEPTAFRPPFYPFFLAMIYLVGGEGNLIAVGVVQVLLDAINASLIAYLCFIIWERTISMIVAGVIAGIYPVFVFQTSLILSEVPHRTIQLIFLIFLIKAVKDKNLKKVGLAGLIGGFSILSKPVLLITYPFLCLWLWYVWKNDKKVSKYVAVIVFALISVCIVGFWTTRNFLISKKFIPVSSNFPITFTSGVTKFSFYTHKWYGEGKCMPVEDNFLELTQLRYYQGVDEEVKIGRAYANRALDFIKQNPYFYIKLTVRKFLHFWSPLISNTLSRQIIAFVSMAPVLLFGWLGIVYTLFKEREKRAYAVLAILIALPVSFIYSISQPDIRYRISIIDPLWIIFAAEFVCIKFVHCDKLGD